ncbi:hypothetical protein PVAP13_4NG296866 [Panicum virgatum]|uniref:Uncharacterized protein n=1 Tax=Panicum virgatum TaxID=38727 RepID=A0A8T0TFU6_PANVG|nr:hypothetical protein PVAP13_4NG296866 [Panicum virgatum]
MITKLAARTSTAEQDVDEMLLVHVDLAARVLKGKLPSSISTRGKCNRRRKRNAYALLKNLTFSSEDWCASGGTPRWPASRSSGSSSPTPSCSMGSSAASPAACCCCCCGFTYRCTKTQERSDQIVSGHGGNWPAQLSRLAQDTWQAGRPATLGGSWAGSARPHAACPHRAAHRPRRAAAVSRRPPAQGRPGGQLEGARALRSEV